MIKLDAILYAITPFVLVALGLLILSLLLFGCASPISLYAPGTGPASDPLLDAAATSWQARQH